MRKILFIILIIIISFFLYGRYINPNGLNIKEYNINVDYVSDGFDSFKIAHFSDLLYDLNTDPKQLDKLTESINEMNADIIVFTGDLVSKDYKLSNEKKQLLIDTLKKMKCNLYKYAVIGDSDLKISKQYENIMNQANFKLLDNDYDYLFYKDTDPIKIIGLTDKDKIDKILKDDKEIKAQYKIVLTHYSDNYDKLKDLGIDLVLAGNSLGGQIRLPFVGGLITKTGSKQYIDNAESNKLSKLYVSNGIGTEKYHFRTFNTPTVNLYRLHTKN